MSCVLGHVLIPDSVSEHTNFTVTFVLFQPLALAAGVATTLMVGGVVSTAPARVPQAIRMRISASARGERVINISTQHQRHAEANVCDGAANLAGRRGFCL